MKPAPFTESDLHQWKERSLDADRIQAQIGLFRDPPPPIRLDRPAVVGDGIHVLDESHAGECLVRHDSACSRGRFLKFVPSSGAATRMFAGLLKGDPAEIRRFVSEIRRFPFFEDISRGFQGLGRSLEDLLGQGDTQGVLDTFLSPSGLAYAHQPKGLLAFHRYTEGSRTALEEHLVEAAQTVRDARGICRLHFTVSSHHLSEFEAFLARVRGRWEKALGCRLEVHFSVQKASTETLAVDLNDEPFRDAEGRLVFRPGGHGALLENLKELDGDLVYIKNIDNVVPDRLKGPTLRWKKVLGGLLAWIQEESFRHLCALEKGKVPAALMDEARAFLRQWFFRDPLAGGGGRGDPSVVLMEELDRPLRVCGMVRNTGEPGGGPFWVRDAKGCTTLQIVEKSQVDSSDPAQAEVLASATHFNPVDLVCGMRDHRGGAHDLSRRVDMGAVIISRKTDDGKRLKALEWPGLWNGSMHGWNTVLVEVPLETFDPVKTAFDLLRPRHSEG